MDAQELDYQVRLAAFQWLAERVTAEADILSRDELTRGFLFQGERVPLMSPQGIFKPSILPEIPLTITTVFAGPYDDSFGPDGLLKYRYRGEDPFHRDNVGLRRAMELGVPLIYFHAIVKGQYLATWPVFIVGDDPASLTFSIAVDDLHATLSESSKWYEPVVSDTSAEARRSYITASVRQRLHQSSFRVRVLRAYREQCALCRLRHRELLDAAHIIEDAEPEGDPLIPNGLALCKLHHAAFDRFILGITPDYIIEVRTDILEEIDGPMLQHGLQGLHSQRILLPRSLQYHPDRDRLALRYERFRKAG